MTEPRILLTGFGAFGSISENPSQILASESGQPHQILEVAYLFVDEWLESLDPESFDALILIGVSAGASTLHLERIGHNRISRTPDVRGYTPRRKRIERGAPWRRRSNLWRDCRDLVRSEPLLEFSSDAGGYLCNYSLYRALSRFPDKQVGFLHVPIFRSLDQHAQQVLLQKLVSHLRHKL